MPSTNLGDTYTPKYSPDDFNVIIPYPFHPFEAEALKLPAHNTDEYGYFDRPPIPIGAVPLPELEYVRDEMNHRISIGLLNAVFFSSTSETKLGRITQTTDQEPPITDRFKKTVREILKLTQYADPRISCVEVTINYDPIKPTPHVETNPDDHDEEQRLFALIAYPGNTEYLIGEKFCITGPSIFQPDGDIEESMQDSITQKLIAAPAGQLNLLSEKHTIHRGQSPLDGNGRLLIEAS